MSGSCVTGQYNDRFIDVKDDTILPLVDYGSCSTSLEQTIKTSTYFRFENNKYVFTLANQEFQSSGPQELVIHVTSDNGSFNGAYTIYETKNVTSTSGTLEWDTSKSGTLVKGFNSIKVDRLVDTIYTRIIEIRFESGDIQFDYISTARNNVIIFNNQAVFRDLSDDTYPKHFGMYTRVELMANKNYSLRLDVEFLDTIVTDENHMW